MPESGSFRSQVQLCNPHDGTRTMAWEAASVRPISTGTRGIHIEVVRNQGWHVDDLRFDGHFIGLNLTPETLHFDARCGGGDWNVVRLSPGAFWIVPEGQRFSIRTGPSAVAAAAVIDGGVFDAVLGSHHRLETCSAHDVGISHLFRALIELGQAGSDQALIRSLVQSFILALAQRYGSPAPTERVRHTLSQQQLQALLTWIDDHLAEALTIERMAGRVGMPAAHFARAFKRATALSPWAHVVEQRLRRAASLLCRGESAASVAARCGFSDQAHLGRLFKRRFGVPPVAYSIRHRRAPTPPAA